MIFCLDVNETHYKKKEILQKGLPQSGCYSIQNFLFLFLFAFSSRFNSYCFSTTKQIVKRKHISKTNPKICKKNKNKKNKRNKRGKKYTFLRLSKTSGFDSPSSGNQRGHRRSPRVGKGERERETSTSLNFSRSRNHLKKRRRIYKRRCHPIPSPLIKEKLFKPGFDASTAKFVKRLKF